MAVEMENIGTVAPRPEAELPPPRPLSRVFTELGQSAEKAVSVETVRDALADRSFAALLVFFAAINMLPLPPGTSVILGIPLLIVAIQMVLGRRTAWLPRFVLNKSISKERFCQLAQRVSPWLVRLETFVRPRYWPFSRRVADRWIGSVALVLALAVTIPIPFGNWPPACAIAIVGVALSERDGVLLAIGIGFGLLSLGIIAGVVGTAGALAALYLV